MSTFQVVLLVVFGLLLVVAVLLFAAGNFGQQTTVPTIVVWGTIPSGNMRDLLEEMDRRQKDILKVTYVEKDPATFDKDFTEAIATDAGPDLVILPDNLIVTERNKLVPIPLATVTDRQVKDGFIEEASLFSTSKGYLALPFTIDPMVMYWNRSLFQAAGISKPPSYWDELANLSASLTKKDQSSDILQSTISFGEFQNVANAKEIISTLIFQAGSPITIIGGPNDPNPDKITAVLDQKFSATVLPAEAALDFYTQFADPAQSVFSWNRSLPLSTDDFTAGNLAIYLGFASELSALRDKNPNLDFDVAPIPQPRDATTKITFGRMTGLAMVRNSPNSVAAYNSMRILVGQTSLSILSSLMNLPPVRRDLLAVAPTDADMAVFYASALQSEAWLDPNPSATNQIFSDMVESITSGDKKSTEAINDANVKLQNLIH